MLEMAGEMIRSWCQSSMVEGILNAKKRIGEDLHGQGKAY